MTATEQFENAQPNSVKHCFNSSIVLKIFLEYVTLESNSNYRHRGKAEYKTLDKRAFCEKTTIKWSMKLLSS